VSGRTPAPPVVELRRYDLRPGRRDELIELFDRELVESQEATGMRVLGQFRDVDRPDHFVWLRGFDDMDSRRAALTAFYGGPVWAANRDAANATMVAVDDVLLLRPAEPGSGLALRSLHHRDDPRCSAVVVLVAERSAADVLRAAVAAMVARGLSTLGCYETDPRENTFPRLPVRAADVVVWIGGLAAADRLEQVPGVLGGVAGGDALTALRLVPTARSLVDGS